MGTVDFANIHSELLFGGVYGLHQEWKAGDCFHYTSTPRPNHGLMLVRCPRVRFLSGNGTQEFYDGNVVYLPQGLYYSAEMYPEPGRSSSALINFGMTLRTGESAAFFPGITRLLSDATPKYSDDFEAVIAGCGQTRRGFFPMMEAFFRLLGNLSAHYGRRGQKSEEYQRLIPALRHLEEHPAEDVPVGELARMCLMSESCFRRAFTRCTGESPVAYRRALRLEKARQMLGIYEMTVGEIAEALGFYDEAYFCRVFEEATGMSPGRYRARG